jgi:hypothetical protein
MGSDDKTFLAAVNTMSDGDDVTGCDILVTEGRHDERYRSGIDDVDWGLNLRDGSRMIKKQMLRRTRR